MGNWYDVVFWSQITPGYATQTSPGVWNEEVLLGMDFVLDQARARGLKIIWALADNWYPRRRGDAVRGVVGVRESAPSEFI